MLGVRKLEEEFNFIVRIGFRHQEKYKSEDMQLNSKNVTLLANMKTYGF